MYLKNFIYFKKFIMNIFEIGVHMYLDIVVT